MVAYETVNFVSQFFDTGKNSAINRTAFQLSKPALYSIKPRCAGWGEMHFEARIGFEPLLHFNCFVCTAVVQNNVEVNIWRNCFFSLPKKIQKFFRSMPCCRPPDTLTGYNVKESERLVAPFRL